MQTVPLCIVLEFCFSSDPHVLRDNDLNIAERTGDQSRGTHHCVEGADVDS